jgi:hypothetical protein
MSRKNHSNINAKEQKWTSWDGNRCRYYLNNLLLGPIIFRKYKFGKYTDVLADTMIGVVQVI